MTSFASMNVTAVLTPKIANDSLRARFFLPKSQPSSLPLISIDTEIVNDTKKNILVCPACYEPLIWNDDPALSVDSAPRSSLQCGTCQNSYRGSSDTHLDLTVLSGNAKVHGEPMATSTEFFRSRLIPFIYERGWRQSFFVWWGYPGPKKEFKLMKDYLKPVLSGNIVDASCGSGLFSRLFAKSGLFSLVVGLDFSENMLRQCHEFVKQEQNFPKENLILVRADIATLPFPSSSIDAVHAGAALHCWPSPLAAVAEISRVLRPGGVFVATTFILDGPYSLLPLLKPLIRKLMKMWGTNFFLSTGELEDLCATSGLVGFTCVRNRRFVMIDRSYKTKLNIFSPDLYLYANHKFIDLYVPVRQ